MDFLDITRIVGRIGRTSPVGIDRVEYAYAREIFLEKEPKHSFGVVTTPWASGAISGDGVTRILSSTQAGWGNGGHSNGDPTYLALKRCLEAPVDLSRTHPRRFSIGPSSRVAVGDWLKLPFIDLFDARSRLKKAANAAGKSGTFFHVSHLLLELKNPFAWAINSGVKRILLVHDAIPIEFPEFCLPGRDITHLHRLKNVSNFASLLIAISHSSARSLENTLRGNGFSVPPILVNPLGVDPLFHDQTQLNKPHSETPYFVCVGTIEPRKNIGFLLQVWARLAELLGPKTPRLLVVGRRGWMSENVFGVLERSRNLAPFIIEVNDLTDGGIASLVSGSRALLAPSMAEGFGLPLVEALTLGVPVVASDIDVHREIGGAHVTYVSGVGGTEWIEAIVALCEGRISRPKGYVPRTWKTHVSETLGAVQAIA